MTPVVRTYKDLYLACLTSEMHEGTCGYWFTVRTDGGSLPHTAFRTRAALLHWMGERNLCLSAPLPVRVGQYQWQRLLGSYRVALWPGPVTTLPGFATRVVNNGQYTEARIERDQKDVVTIHIPHPGDPGAVFDYRPNDDFYSGEWGKAATLGEW